MRTRRLAVYLSLLVSMCFTRADAQTIRVDFPSADGEVYATAVRGNTLYIGGEFTRLGPASGAWIPFDGATGAIVPGFPPVRGNVRVIEPDHLGGWYIGGSFTRVGTQSRKNLAHIRGDFSVSPWNPSPNLTVHCLALYDTTLYVGGSFTTIDGQARNRVAAFDTTTGLLTAWDPGADNLVRVIVPGAQRIFIGGDFTTIGGQARKHAAALSPAGTMLGWNPDPSDDVYALVYSPGSQRVYLGGRFTTLWNGTARAYVAEVNSTNGQPTSWAPNASHDVHALAVSDSVVYASGAFTSIGGANRLRLAAIARSTGVATAWNPGSNSIAYDLLLDGSTLYMAGGFTEVGGAPRHRLAACSVVTGTPTAWAPDPNNTAYALASSGGTVCAGGDFYMIGGVERMFIAAIDIPSGQVTAWNPGANREVRAIATTDSVIYAGGWFDTIGGQTRYHIAALDIHTGLATSWNPATDDIVRALKLSGDVIYAGGDFTEVGGQAREKLAAIDLATGAPTAWAPYVFPGPVETIETGGGVVYVGGQLAWGNSAGAVAFDSTGAQTPWNPNLGGTVWTLARDGAEIFACGSFITVYTGYRPYLVRVDTLTGYPTSFNASAGGEVLDIALDGDDLYVGGLFATMGGGPRPDLAAVDKLTGAGGSWDPGVDIDGQTLSLAVHDGSLYAGGGFWGYGLDGSLHRNLVATGLIPTGVEGDAPAPVRASLRAAPNPFGQSTEIRFTLSSPSAASVRVYDVAGRLVRTLASGPRAAGEHALSWDGRDARGRNVPAGVYFVKLQDGARAESRKIVLVR